jgi:very-short-patch-repair endonuclease
MQVKNGREINNLPPFKMNKSKNIQKDFLIEEYINKKKSACKIVEELKCSSTIVYKYLKRYNIKTRSFSESQIGLHEGKNNSRYIDGRSSAIYYCIDSCSKRVSKKGNRCRECYYKFNRGPNHSRYKEKPKCIDCEKEIKHEGRCIDCYKIFQKIPENNSNFKDGKITLICICGIKFEVPRGRLKRSKHLFCSRKCAGKWKEEFYKEKNNPNFGNGEKLREKWKNDEVYARRVITNTLKALNFRKNKIEIKLENILNSLFPNEYKYVGDGQLFISRYVPDFINANGQKKIIELFGDYWHNLPNYKKRDIKRLEAYKNYGYDTLVIWENELEDISLLKEKLIKFHKL